MEHSKEIVKYIRSHGYRVITHDDGSATIYVLVGDNSGNEIPFKVQSLDQARSAMGY